MIQDIRKILKEGDNDIKLVKRRLKIYNLLNRANWSLEYFNIREIYNIIYDNNSITYYYKIIDDKFDLNNLDKYKSNYEESCSFLKSILKGSDVKIDKDKYPNSIFLFDKETNEFVVECNIKNNTFYLNYSKLWEVFRVEWDYNSIEISNLCYPILEEHFKCKEFTTTRYNSFKASLLEEHFKCKEFKTSPQISHNPSSLEDHFKCKEFTTNACSKVFRASLEEYFKCKEFTT